MKLKTLASPLIRIVLVGLIGNVMEWYDFAVYGFFAAVIGKLFFPAHDPVISLIESFGAFAAGFLMRPLGGLLFGRIGDLVGRPRAMILSIMAMAIPTVLIGLLPTHETIGMGATIAIILLRMVQGLSVGGEFTSSLIFLTEQAPPGHRGIIAVWGSWGASAGVLLGSCVGLMLTSIYDEAEILQGAWRIPFLLGGVVALTGYWIRYRLHVEMPVAQTTSPVRDAFTHYRRNMFRVALLNLGVGVAYYTAFVYLVSYIRTLGDLGGQFALEVNTLAMLVLLTIMPFAAWLSDRVGRRPVMLVAGVSLVVIPWLLIRLIQTGDPTLILMAEIAFALIVGLMQGSVVAANVELMPSPVRCTGLAFSYNISMGLFGGTTPMIAAWLVNYTGNPMAPAGWVSLTAAISLLVLLAWVPETRNQPLS